MISASFSYFILSIIIEASVFASGICLHFLLVLPGGKTRMTEVLEPFTPMSVAFMSSADQVMTLVLLARLAAAKVAKRGSEGEFVQMYYLVCGIISDMQITV